jgi:hypothetical protein
MLKPVPNPGLAGSFRWLTNSSGNCLINAGGQRRGLPPIQDRFDNPRRGSVGRCTLVTKGLLAVSFAAISVTATTAPVSSLRGRRDALARQKLNLTLG